MPPSPQFSIVIPSLNEEAYLPDLLTDLSQQTFQDFEVIHVDGNSDDKTVAVAKKFSKKLTLTSKVVQQRNVAHQRNVGGKLAKAPWIIFMDADNRLPNYFLQGIKYQIEKNEAESAIDIFTTWVTVPSKKPLDRTMENIINSVLVVVSQVGKETAFGALTGVRKSVFEKVLYDEKQKVFEDWQFAQDVVAAGYAYHLFKEPRFVFSTRRVDTEGKLRMVGIVAQAHLKYLFGEDFESSHFGYVMKGGKYYSQAKGTPLASLQAALESLSQSQLKKIKQTLKKAFLLEEN